MLGRSAIPWQLDIHLIDVGQGDCTLIVADNAALGQTRSMLIDAGHPVYGEIAHNYIVNTAGLNNLHRMLLTHYNEDHGGGLRALLVADDLSNLAQTLTTVAAPQANGANRPQQVAAVAAAVYSAALGNYGANTGFANNAANSVRHVVLAGDSDAAAVSDAVQEANYIGGPAGVPSLIPYLYRRRSVARDAGIAAANAIAAGTAGAALTTAIRTAIFNSLRTGVMAGARFWTGNIYNATTVIDLGNTADTPAGWNGVIGGQFSISATGARAPGAVRQQLSAPAPAFPLGREVLWNAAPNGMAAPANAPRAYVVSKSGLAWQGTGIPPFQVATGYPDNDTSIGLVIKFGNFTYYTAGDLPSTGEDPLMNAIVNQLLGGAVADRIGSFKCSHHGSDSSTSAAFLVSANPKTALISCGNHPTYEHPDDDLVDRLYNRAGLSKFFLTNCNFQSAHVPVSMGLNQLTTAGNRSRVAGDNNQDNTAVGRRRGNIRLRITQAQATAPVGARQYTIRYWEDDQVPAGFRLVTTAVF